MFAFTEAILPNGLGKLNEWDLIKLYDQILKKIVLQL